MNNKQIKAQMEIPAIMQKLLDEKNKEILKDKNHPIYKELYDELYKEIGQFMIKPLEKDEN